MDLSRAAAALALLSLALIGPGCGAAAAAEPAAAGLRLNTDAGSLDFGTVEATGLAAEILEQLRHQDWTAPDRQATFAVYTGSEPPLRGGKPAVSGEWAVDGEVLRFRPRYPLVPGLTYVARLDFARLHQLMAGTAGREAPITTSFSLPAEVTEPSTRVEEVYPTAAELPENLLRLYVQFSAPMGRGEAYRHIRLIDSAGGAVDRPFLEVGEELWDPAMRRLTLFFDPGRIKRGLRPHLEAGPPLEAGAAYRLVIDPAWRDADGLPLAAGFEKAFTVTAADRQALDPQVWRITAPVAGSQSPLELRFPEPLDHGLLHRVVRVIDADGRPVAGRIEVTDQERRLGFVPQRAWRAGTYAIEVATILEDVAGNNLAQVFDLDVSVDRVADTAQGTVSLPFRVADR